MLDSFNRNFDRYPQGYRYTKDMLFVTAFMRILGGRYLFEFVKANAARAVPSVRAIDRFISQYKSETIEGKLRTEQLLSYLIKQNLPLYVSLSEDATALTGGF